MLSKGGRIGYYQGDVKLLVDDIGALQPTIFVGVPRVFDRIYSGVTAKIAAGGGLKARLFHWGFARKQYFLKQGYPQDQVRRIKGSPGCRAGPVTDLQNVRLELIACSP